MTMPDERMRALRWGHEMLRELASDTQVDEQDRALAARLTDTYPSPAEMLQWTLDGSACIPGPSATAIAQAAELFHRVWRQQISAGTRRALMFTLRDFPRAEEAMRRSCPVKGLSLRDWLLPDDRTH